MTGLSGVVGASAACGRVLGLDDEHLIWMLGLAATQAGGLRATHESMASPIVPALATRNALSAAYLARSGYQCGPAIIEGRNGLLDILAPDMDPASLLDGLGEPYRRYAAGRSRLVPHVW